ncbi:PQQ-binding-like beta-propeller repeat protein [Clostridium botulinum]|nr:PQQ-binding-like beta-propeller repeat protein [Clostridium botulinum]
MIKSFPFNAVINQNGTPDRVYLAEDFAGYFAKFIGTGVYPNPATGLQVISIDNDMNIRIKKGNGYILGREFENTDDYIIKLDVADGVLSRIDRVVLRLDYLDRKIKPILKKGDYTSNPVAKSLQRDADAYEIALADVYIKNGVINVMQSNITDLRLNKELCGIVHGVIQQVDTTEIFRQFQAWFSEQRQLHEGDFEKWLNEFKIATGKKFEDWVNDLKNSLDPNEDIAAQLQMQISTIKSDLADIATDTKRLTNAKDITGAINELFTNADNGKQSWVDVIGSPLLNTDNFSTLKYKTRILKNTFASNLTAKGQSSSETESLSNLINKIKQIETGVLANLAVELNRFTSITTNKSYIRQIAVDIYGSIYAACNDKFVRKISSSGYTSWEYNCDAMVFSVAVKDGYVYSGDYKNYVTKIDSSSGNKIWACRASSDWGIYCIIIDKDNNVYVGTDKNEVVKINSTGTIIWRYDKHKNDVKAIVMDKNGYIYSGGSRLVKLCSNGGEEWIQDFGHRIASMAIDNNGYVYIGYVYNGVAKINPDNGERIWYISTGDSSNSVDSIVVDDYGYVYAGINEDETVRKISPDGKEIWKYNCDCDGYLKSIALDNYGYIYVACGDMVRKLTDKIYIKK